MRELEINILRYFFQHKQSIDYLEHGIDASIFTDATHHALFQIYMAYVAKYKSVPEKNNLVIFMSENSIDPKHIEHISRVFPSVYEPFEDLAIIEEALLLKVKKLLHTRAIQDSLQTLGDQWNEKDVTKLYKKISSIDQLDIHGRAKDCFLLEGLATQVITLPTPYPTCFENFNKIIGLGGFYPPQLITILKGPKSMGTTFLLHLAVGYVKNGLPVTYIDWENGQSQIATVLQQMLANVRVEFLYADHNRTSLEQKLEKVRAAGQDIHYIKLRAKRDGLMIAEDIIDRRFDQTGRKPKALFYDYLDITGGDKSKDRRERVQMAYADASTLNGKYDAFGITVSKITRGSKNKEFLTEEDAAEDNEKAYNVDAMFAIRRGEEEVEAGIGYITPIVQRSGASNLDIKCVLDMSGDTRYIGDSLRTY